MAGRGEIGASGAAKSGHVMAILHGHAAEFGTDEAVAAGDDESSHGNVASRLRKRSDEEALRLLEEKVRRGKGGKVRKLKIGN
jgi:hypothetical protein